MAYMLLVVGVGYTLAWGAGLLFAVKTEGQKNVLVPAMGLLVFLTLSGVAGQASMAAMKNPPRLTPDAFMAIQEGMTPEQVVGILGGPDSSVDRTTMDLTGRGVSVPSDVAGRLNTGGCLACASSLKSSSVLHRPSNSTFSPWKGAAT